MCLSLLVAVSNFLLVFVLKIEITLALEQFVYGWVRWVLTIRLKMSIRTRPNNMVLVTMYFYCMQKHSLLSELKI